MASSNNDGDLKAASSSNPVSPVETEPKKPRSILAANSRGCGVAACIVAAIFFVFPKHGIAVVPFFSMLASFGLSWLGIIFGLLALMTRNGRSRLCAIGLLLSVAPLVYFLLIGDR